MRLASEQPGFDLLVRHGTAVSDGIEALMRILHNEGAIKKFWRQSSNEYGPRVPRPKVSPTTTPNKRTSGDEEKQMFEAELFSGRSRLRKVSGAMDVGDGAPPPPPPPPADNIPPAPRLPLPPPPPPATTSGVLSSMAKKVVNAGKFGSANPRDELMSAIRAAGGKNGLRKVRV